MSVRIALPILILTAFVGLVAGAVTASAAPPPRVEGLYCTRALKASAPANAFWWAVFQGERKGFFGGRETTRQLRCFRSQADCKAWLYWVQSDWPDLNQLRRCKRGFPF